MLLILRLEVETIVSLKLFFVLFFFSSKVAANALIVLSNLLTLQPGEDVRVREREVKPLVAFLAEKRFAVQVHLLYKKQGGDKPRNMFALMKWALTALSSPLAKDMLSKESDGEYLRELQQIAQINKKQQL